MAGRESATAAIPTRVYTYCDGHNIFDAGGGNFTAPESRWHALTASDQKSSDRKWRLSEHFVRLDVSTSPPTYRTLESTSTVCVPNTLVAHVVLRGVAWKALVVLMSSYRLVGISMIWHPSSASSRNNGKRKLTWRCSLSKYAHLYPLPGICLDATPNTKPSAAAGRS